MKSSNRIMLSILSLLVVSTVVVEKAAAQVVGGIVRPDPRPGDGRPDPYPHRPDPYEPGRPDPYQPEPHRPDPYRPDPYRPDPYRPEPPPPYYGGDTKTAYISRNVIDETLPLRRLLDLDRDDVNQELTSIRVDFRMPYRAVVLELLVNGGVVTSQTVYDRSEIVFDIPGRRMIGTDIRTLQLRVRGSLYIDRITAELDGRGGGGGGYNPPPYGPRQEIVDVFIGRYTNFRDDRIDLTYQIDRYRLAGYRIDEIIVEAETRGPSLGEIGVAINGFRAANSQVVPRFGSVYLRVNSMHEVGRDLRSIELLTRGDLYVRSAQIRLVRR